MPPWPPAASPPPSKKRKSVGPKAKAKTPKRPKKESESVEAWAERMAQLIPLLTRLGEAEDSDRAKLADELKAWVAKRRSFTEELNLELQDLVKPLFEAAVHSQKLLLRIPLDVFKAWEPVMKAGIVLVELDRAKSQCIVCSLSRRPSDDLR